jgi:hypothetical protein
MRIDRIKPKKTQFSIELRNEDGISEYKKFNDNEALLATYNDEEKFSTTINTDELTDNNNYLQTTNTNVSNENFKVEEYEYGDDI